MAVNYVAVGAGAVAGAVLLPVLAPVILPVLGVGAVLGMFGISATAALGAVAGGLGIHYFDQAVNPPPAPPSAPTKLTP
jgi:hypothetical protein